MDKVKPKVYKLVQWALRQTSQGSIFLEGYLENTNLLWRSSCLTSRISARRLSTGSGSIYELIGPIDYKASLNHGVSPNLVEAFWNGFPENWENHLSSDILGITPDNTNMTLLASRFDTSTFEKTRSGRIVIPRLASWRGERLIWQKNGDFSISLGFLEAISGESVSTIKSRLRKQHRKIIAVIDLDGSHSIHNADTHMDASAHENPPRNSTRKKASVSKETCKFQNDVVQKENSVPKKNFVAPRPHTSKKECSKITRASARNCYSLYSETEVNTTTTAEVGVKKKDGGILMNRVPSQSMLANCILEKIKQPRSWSKLKATPGHENSWSRKPSQESQDMPAKRNGPKRSPRETLLENSVAITDAPSWPEKREIDKVASKAKSLPAKGVKRKCMDDEPVSENAKRNRSDSKKVTENPVSENCRKKDLSCRKAALSQEKITDQDEIISEKPVIQHRTRKSRPTPGKSTKKDGMLKAKGLPKPVQCKNTDKAKTVERNSANRESVSQPKTPKTSSSPNQNTKKYGILKTKSLPKKKSSKPEPVQGKNTDKAITAERNSTKRASVFRSKTPKASSSKNADLSKDDSCLTMTPCSRQIVSCNKQESRSDTKKKMARPGTLRYEKDIRTFIKEYNEDEDDDDFLATTPYRDTVSTLRLSKSFLEKVQKDYGDEDIINMLTPKSTGGLPSPFTAKKTPDISGGTYSQLIEPENMKYTDQLVYRINKRKKAKTQASGVINKPTTPVLPKLSDTMNDYVLEALSDHESDDDEDKDYYFSDDEEPINVH